MRFVLYYSLYIYIHKHFLKRPTRRFRVISAYSKQYTRMHTIYSYNILRPPVAALMKLLRYLLFNKLPNMQNTIFLSNTIIRRT